MSPDENSRNKEKVRFGAPKPLAIAIASAFAFAHSATPLYAEDVADTQEDDIEEVIVTGIRGSLMRAMDIKKDSDTVVDSIASEDLGKFPDQNLAESIQRISGVSVDRSGGEGQLVTVRGFGPQFNSVLLNGRQMATENQGREYSFDTLPAELVSGVDVHKTSIANQQEGGIGATIDIKTIRPLEIGEFRAIGTAKGIYDNLVEETAPQMSALVSNTFLNDTVGVMVSLSHQERKVQNNIVETRYYRPVDQLVIADGSTYDNVFVPQNFDTMVDLQDRTRSSGTAVVQFQPSSDLLITMDSMVSNFDVDSDTHSLGHWFTDGNFDSVSLDGNRTVTSIANNANGATDFIRRRYGRDVEVQAHGLNVEWNLTSSLTSTIDVSRSFSRDLSGADIPFTVIGYNNAYNWDINGNGEVGSINVAGGQPALLDVSAGRAHYNELNGENRRDEINEVKVDFQFTPDSELIQTIDFGVYSQSRQKDKQRKFASNCAQFCGYGTDISDSLLSTFNADNYFSGLPNTWLTYDPNAYLAELGIDAPSTQADKFNIKEDITAAFLSTNLAGQVAGKDWYATVGIRYSQTETESSGFSQQLADLEAIPNDPSDLNEVYADEGNDVSSDSSYSNLLPSLNGKLEVADDMFIRAAYSQTITRPTMNALVPSTTVTVSRPNNNAAVGGNPDLKPYLSNNLDATFEWYYSDASFVTIGLFQKRVEDFIANTNATEVFALDSGNYDFSVTRPRNSRTATATGLEFSALHTFENGFGIQFNATDVDSDAELDLNNLSEAYALEGLGNSQNLIAFFEQGPVQARIAYNNRENFLQFLTNPRGGSEPVYVETYGQWDASASYDVNENFTVLAEAINLTGEQTRRHGRYRNQLISLEDNGARFLIGIRAKF